MNAAKEAALAHAPPLEMMPVQEEDIPDSISEALAIIGSIQADALKDAKVSVHRAYLYEGYSWFEPAPDQRLVAVDVEFVNYLRGFDLDDVDVIDADSNENYGSDPYIGELTPAGERAFDAPIRRILVYSIPKSCKAIKLSYWNQLLTPDGVPLADDGPSLPSPEDN